MDPRFDWPVCAVGALVTAALSVGFATAFLFGSQTTTGPGVGPTAATVDDAFSSFVGAGLGLLAGSLLSARFARRGSGLATGLLAGFFAYAAVFIVLVIATGPSTHSAGKWFGLVLLLGVPLSVAGITGSMIGASIGAASTRRRLRRHTSGERPSP